MNCDQFRGCLTAIFMNELKMTQELMAALDLLPDVPENQPFLREVTRVVVTATEAINDIEIGIDAAPEEVQS